MRKEHLQAVRHKNAADNKMDKDIFNLYDHIHFLAIHNRYIFGSFCKCFQFPASVILFEISHFIVSECTIFVQLDLIVEAIAFGKLSCLSKTLLSALRAQFIKSTLQLNAQAMVPIGQILHSNKK